MKIEYISKNLLENSILEIIDKKELADKIIIKENFREGITIEFFDKNGIAFYGIHINPKELVISQVTFRPNHDHNNNCEFRKQKEGWGWYSDWPRDNKIERISFGKEIVNY